MRRASPVSREHRRAKSDRLDIGLLKRSFLGWLRGEPKHCSMVAVPTREAEDDKRPLREREALTAESTRLVNRIKSLLVLHGIHDFKVKRRKAAAALAGLVTAEGKPLPPKILAELQRTYDLLGLVHQQIAAIDAEQARQLEVSLADELSGLGSTRVVRFCCPVRRRGDEP